MQDYIFCEILLFKYFLQSIYFFIQVCSMKLIKLEGVDLLSRRVGVPFITFYNQNY